MKIGLLTTYSFNYGSYYQAVSLQKKLQDMGHKCELINEEFKKYKWLNLFLLYSIDPFLIKPLKNMVSKKFPQYDSYLNIKNDTKNLECSPSSRRNFRKLSQYYDCIIVGSDELWSANKASIRFVPEYFGYGCRCPVFSYATCAVKFDTDNKLLIQKARKGLRHFQAISVRDDISKKKIEKILPDRRIAKVLDPTLLNPFFAVGNAKRSEEKFVLLYGQHYDRSQIAFIKKYAKINKCRIFCVGWKQAWCDEFINTNSSADLQNIFAKAEFCFPSTFHGTVFSIVNHKQFIAMCNPLRGEKIELLLEDLHLQDRIFDKTIDVSKIQEINYGSVEEILNEYREKSQRYLIRTLERIMMKCR